MSKKTNYSYVGIAFIILVFGIIFIPKIINRVSEGDIIRDESRSEEVSVTTDKKGSDLLYIEVNGEKRKVPAFSFTDQDGNTITNKDYLGKVYVVEFFFTIVTDVDGRLQDVSRHRVGIDYDPQPASLFQQQA